MLDAYHRTEEEMQKSLNGLDRWKYRTTGAFFAVFITLVAILAIFIHPN